MAYSDLTVDDPSFIKRWIQNRRFVDAVGLLNFDPRKPEIRVLDFGAGDGELIRCLSKHFTVKAWVYEPSPKMIEQAKKKLSKLHNVQFSSDINSLESGFFDFIFCLEVFEHLPDKETFAALESISKLLKDDGEIIIGVPHELFLVAFLKGIFRMVRRYGDFDANLKNVIMATLGLSSRLERPVKQMSVATPSVCNYHSHHLGFDYRIFEQRIGIYFSIILKRFSPAPLLGSLLNSEVYFLLKKKNI